MKKNLQLKKQFDADVCEAIQLTSIEERAMIAAQYEMGICTSWPHIEARGAKRIPLLIASLVDAESKIVMNGERLKAKSLFDCVCLLVNLPGRPVDKYQKPVDNLWITSQNLWIS